MRISFVFIYIRIDIDNISTAIYTFFITISKTSIILPSKNVIRDLLPFGIVFPFIVFISSSETSTNHQAAILKICAPAIITSREVIIAGYDVILDHLTRISIIT